MAEDDAYVSYLEGCTAPSFDENQLHAAVVELSAGANAEIKYSTVQNWCEFDLYPFVSFAFTMQTWHRRGASAAQSRMIILQAM